ncbi:MAG: LamG-like jellyroll fold domain-containing protein, partial [Limisphaerales bacterium]
MTYDLTNLCLYVNGRLDIGQADGGTMRATAAPLCIGGGPYFLFDGRIDELSIYDRAISGAELQGIYNAGSAGKCALRLPPSIVSQPEPVTVPIGADAVFTVGAQPGSSTDSLAFQWLRDGTILPGMTNETLIVRNAHLTQAGLYSVVVSGSGGKVTSASARLSVVGVIAWGVTEDQQTAVPMGLTDVVAIAAGGLQNMVLRADGTVLVAGANEFGLTNVPSGLSNVVAIAAGSQHCLALKRDGSVIAWGNSTVGQSLVPPGLTTVVAIATGPWHNLALRGDGRVFAWGDNSYGQSTVPGDLTNVVAVAAGLDHSLALRADGTLCAWGNNDTGQNDIPAGLGTVMAVACGTAHNMALLADGTVAAWGARQNDYGQSLVPAGLSNVVAIAAGGFHSLALRSDGNVVAWGTTWGGIANVPAGVKNVMAISASLEHSLALVGNGPPFLTVPLMNRTAPEGGTTVFRAAATGTQPMTYQWTQSGVLLSGETRAGLVLTNLQQNQGGVYAVVISNAVGGLISFGAELRVLPSGSCLRSPAGLVAWWRAESTTRDECSGISGFVPLGRVLFGPGEVGAGFAFNGSG